MAERLTVEVAVVGAGPAGLTAAIGMAQAGLETALVALDARARELPALSRIEGEARAVETGNAGITIKLKGGGTIAARLAVGADGRRSLCRTTAGIETSGSHYPQTALTFNLRHARPHHFTSTEFHTESGPFTLVPLPG